MRFVGPLIVLGLLLLGTGFVVGTEPVASPGAGCGSVLVPVTPRPPDGAGAAACRSARHGGRQVVTWGLLGLGGVAMTVAWTAHREGRPRRRTPVGTVPLG
jgi:hypothetical protein